jgi:hypothetical protein
MFRGGKFIKTKSRLWLLEDEDNLRIGDNGIGYGCLFYRGENILKLIGVTVVQL